MAHKGLAWSHVKVFDRVGPGEYCSTNRLPHHGVPARARARYTAGVDSSDLDPEVAQQLTRAVRERLDWFGRLRRRMELRGFPPTDPLYIAVTRCYNAAQELHVRAHYASCRGGVGRG